MPRIHFFKLVSAAWRARGNRDCDGAWARWTLGTSRVAAALFLGAGVVGCTDGFGTDPLIEYSTEVTIHGAAPQTLTRELRSGTYLVEIRERDIDLRVQLDARVLHTELADAYLRHGVHRTVVVLEAPQRLRLTLSSIDQRSWSGGAAVRILRWPKPEADAAPDNRLLGFMALGVGNELVAGHTIHDWRASLTALRAAEERFRTAHDLRMLAQTEYQRAQVELTLLFEFEAARKTAACAETHFVASDDALGAMRASVLRGRAELRLADATSGHGRRAALEGARARFDAARQFFDAHDEYTDAIRALDLLAQAEQALGRYDEAEKIHDQVQVRGRARGDRYFQALAMQNIALDAARKGEMARAAALFEEAAPLIERDRNPVLYATIIGSYARCLAALGDFDRALLLQTEALELFTARGADGKAALALAALGSIQLRAGNGARAYESLRAALPLLERSGDVVGLASALGMTGTAAAELGEHQQALEYLRRAERLAPDADAAERTRVLIAGEMRVLGKLHGADRLLAGVISSPNELTRAHALAERARLRSAQRRAREALADLRAADALYARLQLDINRIVTSAALARALLDAGDHAGARIAAERAMEIETRIRARSANPELRARFLAASYAPFEASIEVELATAPRDRAAQWRAFRIAEAVRARSLADRLAYATDPAARAAAGERLRQSGDANPETALSGAVPESLEATQALLPAGTAVLAYFVGDERSHAWLLTRSELRHASLLGRRDLETLVKGFVTSLRSGAAQMPLSAFTPLLGDSLLNGVEARRLLVLPDGALHGLPFAALPVPRGSSYELLVDRFVIATAPSLALALKPVPAPRAGGPARVAVISDPVYTPDDRRLSAAVPAGSQFRGSSEPDAALRGRLPYSALEARAVAAAFAGADVIELAGFDATVGRVIELPSRDLDVLHFATHAMAQRDAPDQSALFLSEYARDGSALANDRLTAGDILRSGLRADMVVLSGCATGAGAELRGEGVLGLAYGFLSNGSRTVIASLWPVEDALTARFMEEFYAAYRVSRNANEALRSAQLHTRRMAENPVWASFVVRTTGLP